MDESIKFFVGLDVHKDSIAVAVAEAGRAPARLVGSIAHDVGKLRKLLARYGVNRERCRWSMKLGQPDMACSANWRGAAITAK